MQSTPAETAAAPRCLACHYELTGLSEHTPCPECGGTQRLTEASPPGSTWAAASLLLGGLSLLGWILLGVPCLILGPAAIITGEVAAKALPPGAATQRRVAFAGRLLGWISFTPAAFCLLLLICFPSCACC